MKKITTVLIFFWLQADISAQEFLISIRNQLWTNLNNPVKVMIENVPAPSIFLSTDNGTVYKDKSDSVNRVIASFYIWTEKPGPTTVVVGFVNNSDTITVGKYHYWVKSFPDLILNTYFAKDDTVSSPVLAAQLVLTTTLDPDAGFDFDYNCIVRKYSVVILRGNRCLYANNYEGAKLTSGLKAKFGELVNDDKIIFYDVGATCPDGILKKVRLSILTIKNQESISLSKSANNFPE